MSISVFLHQESLIKSFFSDGFHGNTGILIGVLFSLFSSPHLFLNGNLSGERCRFPDRQMPLEKAAGLNERKLICSEDPVRQARERLSTRLL